MKKRSKPGKQLLILVVGMAVALSVGVAYAEPVVPGTSSAVHAAAPASSGGSLPIAAASKNAGPVIHHANSVSGANAGRLPRNSRPVSGRIPRDYRPQYWFYPPRRWGFHPGVRPNLKSAAAASQPSLAQQYRQQAEHAVNAHQYEQAVHFYTAEANRLLKWGDVNAAKVEYMKAARWSTELAMYVETPARPDVLPYTAAKYEPRYGCYLGAYAYGEYPGSDREKGTGDLPEIAMGKLVGKKLATSFDYCYYGDKFPLEWARALRRQDIAVQIAVEPAKGLSVVQDDAYLQQFARDAAAVGGPVFIRFASEMNGEWTPYHGDPALYRQKFRLVHDVMARLAPNVAMIWCVYQIPEYNILDYYPGDDAVDWVGINVYSVIHHDNSLDSPAWFENPSSMLRYIYRTFADRKPIAVCEYGATHREQLSGDQDYSDFAAAKISSMYACLPRLFPRIKMIDIFDCNNQKFAPIGRRLNNYSVVDNLPVLRAYCRAIAPDYFLTGVSKGSQEILPLQIQPLEDGAILQGVVHLSAWAKTYEDRPLVLYRLDGKPIACTRMPGEYACTLDTTAAPGPHTLTLEMFDSSGIVAAHKDIRVQFASMIRSQTPSRRLRLPARLMLVCALLSLASALGSLVIWARRRPRRRNRWISKGRR